jgi:hypothetical protein
MKVSFLFSHVILAVVDSELFICFIVKQFVQNMQVNCLSHFIIINVSYHHKTKLYQYNTLLMSIKI